tara:strand:- start:19469 stop:20923 length:1455 start_codon:yes stop_codon:yes gene_type:complete
MELIQYRNIEVEKFLNRGFIELEKIQSYIPDGEIECDNANKWTSYKLNSNLQKVTNWDLNKLEGIVIDKNENILKNYKFHIKLLPILDTFYVMRNGYPKIDSNMWLPCNILKINNLCDKLYATNNTAYVDVKCSILLGQLLETNKTPHFNSVLGVYSGIVRDYKEDFTQEYQEYKNKKWFGKALKKRRIRIESHDSQTDTQVESLNVCNLDEYVDNDIQVSIINNDEEEPKTIVHDIMSVQCVIMDRLDSTFLDLINDEIKKCRQISKFAKINQIRRQLFYKKITSWIYQICAGLTVANKELNFVHNDLHVQNVMGKSTNDKYIYYSNEGVIYRVPTYGYIMRIIDFGRSTFSFNGCNYIGDIFNKEGEAGGQYIMNKNKNKRVLPCSSFDLPRFSASFLEDLDEQWPSIENMLESEIGKLMYKWCIDDNGFNILEGLNGFELYVHIARYFRTKKPRLEIMNHVFDEYKYEKKPEDNLTIYYLN